MALIPKSILAKLPRRYATEKQEDPIVQVKLFAPWSGWTWYVLEYDSEDNTCFGLVQGWVVEMGYFSLDELESVPGPFGGTWVERDRHFRPTPLSVIQKALEG